MPNPTIADSLPTLRKAFRQKNAAWSPTTPPSVGGLITIAPLVFSERLRGTSIPYLQALCRENLTLTHPDEGLMQVCDRYVTLLCGLMEGPGEDGIKALLEDAAKGARGLDVAALLKRNLPENQVVGRMYSPACYISDSWPLVLYLAYKYRHDPWLALRVNTNLGGDNVHRGMIIGALLGLTSDNVANQWFDQLVKHEDIDQEIAALIDSANV